MTEIIDDTALPPVFGDIEPDSSDFLINDDSTADDYSDVEFNSDDKENPWTDIINPDIEIDPSAAKSDDADNPDPSLIEPKKQSAKSKRYEKKVKNLFAFSWDMTVEHPATVVDSAAILYHGNQIARAAGDLADDNVKFAAAIDMFTDGTDSPLLNMMIVTTPFLLQLARNHEPILQPAPRSIRLPFMKRKFNLRWKIGIKLGNLRRATNEPIELFSATYSNPQIMELVKVRNKKIAMPAGYRRK